MDVFQLDNTSSIPGLLQLHKLFYPNYVSSIVQELYGGGVAAPDPVRAASLSQQQLVAKQIQQTKDKAKQGISTPDH